MFLFNRFLLIFSLILLPPALYAENLDSLILKADTALEQYKYRTALIHLKNAAKEQPQNLKVRLKLAQLFIHTGQGVQAQVELDKASRLGAKTIDTAVLSAKAKLLIGEFETLTENINLLNLPQTEIARLRAIQGHAFFEQRKFREARQMFQRAILLSPQSIEVELGKAKLLSIDEKKAQQKLLISSLLNRYPHNAEVLIVAGNYYRKNGDFTRALELFNRAGKIQPSNVNVWFGVVRSHIGNSHFNDAKIEIQKVLNSYPEHQVGNYLLSVIAFQEGDFNRAKAAIDIVLKGKKRKFEALKLLSTIQFQQQEYSESEKTIKKYLKFHSYDTEAQKTLAAIYLKRKQGTLALNTLKNLERLDDAYIYSMIATAYLQLGNQQKSDLYINKSIQASPEDKTIKRHFQRAQLKAGESLDVKFTDTNYNNFLSEGHIPILNLLRQKKYDEAASIIQGYLNKSPDNALLHYLMGTTFLYKGENEKAKLRFTKSLQINPELIESRIYLAKILQRDGKELEAEREYREVLRIKKDNDQAMIALAGIYSRAGKKDEMLNWLNKSRKTNTASLASREVLEKFYRDNGDIRKALEISAEMLAVQPQNVNLLLKHANNQKASKQLDLAIITFKRIIDLKPDSSSAWFGLGRLQYLNNELSHAKSSFRKSLSFNPDNLTAKVILVQIAIKTNNLKSAEAQSRKIQKQHPKSPAGFDMLGDVYIKQNNPGKAIQQYTQSSKIKYNSQTYLKLHSAYNRNNQVSKGLKLLKQWVKKYPKDYQLKEVLAISYQRLKKLGKAKALYEEIIQASQNNDRVLNNMALVSLQLKSPMSIEYAEMAYRINPNNHINIDTLGWVLLKNNNLEKAIALLKTASEGSPGNADIRYHYAVALFELGEKAQAKKQLYLAIGSKGKFDNRELAEKLVQKIE
ncbi:MAG: PEP-CTERM system TPR-repeat protein PrsT [Bacteroidetes bacterium]|nr:PEP-CTERM system TPR-repeat protein PrsT [Bacteroidota bacterium]